MAILGHEGYVTLLRDKPDPLLLDSDTLENTKNGWVLDIGDPSWWSGDKVRLDGPLGLPLQLTPGEVGPSTNEGLGMYGPEPPSLGKWTIQRDGGDTSSFYRDGDDANPFYGGGQTVVTTTTVYIHRDALDRISFYTDELSAINGGKQDRLRLYPVLFKDVTLSGAWTDGDGWRQQCDLRQWSFETDPTNLDITAIGEDFGSYTRSLIRGAGAFTALMSNKFINPAICTPSSRIAKLALLRSIGASAKARFKLSDGGGPCSNDPPLWYETSILMGRSSVTVDLDNADTLQAQFVATGEIRLVNDYEAD